MPVHAFNPARGGEGSRLPRIARAFDRQNPCGGVVPTLRRGEVVGLPAVAQKDGRVVGRVNDLIFSAPGDRVIGLLLEGGAWRRRHLIPYEEVGAIGPAAVILRQPVVLRANDVQRLARLRRAHAPVIGLRVLTRDGHDLGTVDDVCFDPADGCVQGYLISGGVVDDVARGRAFLPLERVERGLAGEDGQVPKLLLTTPG